LILVDTNVVMGLMLQGGFCDQARALFERDDDWHTEALLFHELSNTLATQCRVAGLALTKAQALLAHAQQLLAKGRHEVADTDALAAAAHFGISGYDARFIVLARALGTPLVTEDRRLRDAVPAHTRSIAQALMS
jgi:predicted nucleic acid-binding protein